MKPTQTDLLQGTLDLLILKSLTHGSMHGWGVSLRIRELSSDVLEVNQGSLYPALQRLERRGWVDTEWGTSENNRRAKFYRLSPAGRQHLGAESQHWDRFASAVYRILESN